jgi:DNA-binding SARP family transcriptional activator
MTASGAPQTQAQQDGPHDAAAGPDGRRLGIQLLGEVSADWNGTIVRPPSRGSMGLLALVATQRRPRTREEITADLWPDGSPNSAAWLRQALWQLRRAFGAAGANPDAIIESDAERIGLGAGLVLDLDVTRFEALLATAQPDLEGALALYHGEFTEGLDLECFARDRERLADLYEDALAQLGMRCLRDGDIGCARTAALGLMQRDPLREEAHATLIEVYGRTGTRSQVVRQYRRLERLLRQELGVEPLAETQESFRAAMRCASERSNQAVRAGAFDAV